MSQIKKTIGFIGSGNMAEAFIGALLRAGVFNGESVITSDIATQRLKMLEDKYGIQTTTENHVVFDRGDIIVLAVKPQQMDDVLGRLVETAEFPPKNKKIVISIAAGITLGKIESILYKGLSESDRKSLPIVRVMPNTPALVLAGMSGMSPNAHAVESDRETTRIILEALGRVIEFDESRLDGVTAVSGSGPAYVFYFIESMVEGGVRTGLSPEDALTLTRETFIGALKLLEGSGESPESLRRKVTSPGGTTEAALKRFEEKQVRESIALGVEAAAARSKELSG